MDETKVPYVPSAEEVAKAEGTMYPEQAEMSSHREDRIESSGLDVDLIADLSNFEVTDDPNWPAVVHFYNGTLDGHEIKIKEQAPTGDSPRYWGTLDGKALDTNAAAQICQKVKKYKQETSDENDDADLNTPTLLKTRAEKEETRQIINDLLKLN